MDNLHGYNGIAHSPLGWPHDGFLSLAACPALSTHLAELVLAIVKFSEDELLQTLSLLRALEILEISDDPDDESGVALFSSVLLRRLTWTAESTCFVPALKSLNATSVLQLDEHLYLDFVLSRIGPRQMVRGDIRWLSGHGRGLFPEVVEKLAQLLRRRDLQFGLEEQESFQRYFCVLRPI